MSRTTRTITISIPPEMEPQIEKLIRLEGHTRSELLREALKRYVREREWPELASTPSSFWAAKTFDRLAAEQAVYPIADWNGLGGNWPEGANFVLFLKGIEEARRE